MSLERYLPYVKIEFEEPTKAVKHYGYCMTDSMGVVATARAWGVKPDDPNEPQDSSAKNIYYVKEYIPEDQYDEDGNLKENYITKKSLRYDPATAATHLDYSLDIQDNTMAQWGQYDFPLLAEDYRIIKVEGSDKDHIERVNYIDVDTTHPLGQSIELSTYFDPETDLPGINQGFVLSLYRHAMPGYAGVTEHNCGMGIEFGGKWYIGLRINHTPVLFKKCTGDNGSYWREVSQCPSPTLFRLNERDDIVIRAIDHTLIISRGIDYGNDVWTYRDPMDDPADDWETDPLENAPIPRIPVILSGGATGVPRIWSQNQHFMVAYGNLKYIEGGTLWSMYTKYGDASDLTANGGDGHIHPKALYMIPNSQSPCLATVEDTIWGNYWRYILDLGSTDSKYTPVVFQVRVTEPPVLVNILTDYPDGAWSIGEGRLLGGTLNTSAREVNGNITVSNYDGAFTGFHGYHRIVIKLGWYFINRVTGDIIPPSDSEIATVFTGYALDPTYSKDSNGRSIMTLTLRDNSIMMTEQYSWALPVYDGSCIYWAMWDICRRAGCVEAPDGTGMPAVLFSQSPYDASNYVTLKEHLNIQDDWAACERGTCDHVILNRGDWSEPPKYKFQDRLKLMECLLSFSEQFMQHWIYFNNFGNLMIINPQEIYANGALGLYATHPFNELIDESNLATATPYQVANLLLKNPTSHVKNSLRVFGVDSSRPDTMTPAYRGWDADLTNGDALNYRPWYCRAMLRNAQLPDPQLNMIVYRHSKILNRPRPTATWNGFGNPFVFPYNLATISEDTTIVGAEPILAIRDLETGGVLVTLETFRITGVTHNFSDAANKTFTTSYEAEWVDPNDRRMYDPYF